MSFVDVFIGTGVIAACRRVVWAEAGVSQSLPVVSSSSVVSRHLASAIFPSFVASAVGVVGVGIAVSSRCRGCRFSFRPDLSQSHVVVTVYSSLAVGVVGVSKLVAILAFPIGCFQASFQRQFRCVFVAQCYTFAVAFVA